MCRTGSTLQITGGLSSSLENSLLALNAERRPPRSAMLVATAAIRVVATEGQIYGYRS